MNTIKPQFMYEHLRKLIERIKHTIYGTIMFDYKKENILDDSKIIDNPIRQNYRILEQLTLKNIYNFAKSLSRYKKGKEYPVYAKHWKSLEPDEKTEILNRLNGKNNFLDWFNVKRYIRYILTGLKKDVTTINIDTYNLELYNIIAVHYIVEIVFKSLIYKGVLSELKPNKILTDKTFTPRTDRAEIVKKMDPKIFSTNVDNPYQLAYSYLSELPYLFSGDIIQENKSAWFSLYALDWVSQIGFCHKYISQRVSYLTGATGVGKSTQVPKLYMYYLKAIDYNSSGSVVCTQPRKAPTKKNAEQVSKELGFPIFKDYKDTDYYYVQMHHKTQQHKANVSHLSLKYITDGTLVQELKNVSPIMKSIDFTGKKMSNLNTYDIVIIDEAHEHGKNMDILLTLMRDFTYLNPSIRLVILSATMDDDEPVYRRYYRDINDNQKYPYDCSLRDNNLDRINVDRRYHISPVGLGTTHKIQETYLDGANPVDIVKTLVREGLKGDILIFQPGEADIIKIVEELNKNTPDDVIAIPFLSSLTDYKKSFIEDIDKTFGSLRISKQDNFAKVTSLTEGINSYNNCIICSTNIAEASITIRRLYYVIETGTRKTSMYSYTRRMAKLVTLNISESSRLQRKGRVGRTGPGHVYYTYKKGLMENNKILFEFSTGNISDVIFSSIQEKLNENQITLANLLKNKQIKEQFFSLYNTSKGVFNYRGNPTQYDYDYDKKYVPQKFDTGYDSKTLYDANGNFYIVHPEELYIERDLMGRIKASLKKDINYKNGVIESKKINSFYEDLFMKKYIEKVNEGLSNVGGEVYYRTQFGKLINELILTFSDFEDQIFAEMLTFSTFFNTTTDIARIVSLLASLKGDILNMFYELDKNSYDLTTFKSMFTNTGSEFEVLNQLGKEIIKYVLVGININEIDEQIAKQFKLSYNDYKKMIDNFDRIETDDDGKKSKINRESIFTVRVKSILFHPKLDESINTISSILKINPTFIKDFLELFLLSADKVKSLNFPNKRKKTYTVDIELFKKDFIPEIKENIDPIILTMMHVQPFNVAKRIIPTKYFLSVYAPSSENIYGLGTYKQKQKKGITYDPLLLIRNEYSTGYIFYYTINVQRETVVCLAHITKEYLEIFNHLYNYDRLNKVSSEEFQKVEKYIVKINDPKIPHQIVLEDIRNLQHVGSTYKEILKDLNR